MERAFALIFGLGLSAATLWPGFREVTADSFPLSNYPMFSIPRDRAQVNHMVAFTVDDERVPLPPHLVANGEIMQASGTVAYAIIRGAVPMNALCQEVAGRVIRAAADDPSLARIDRIALVTDWYDPVAYFDTGPKPLKSKPHAACRVEH